MGGNQGEAVAQMTYMRRVFRYSLVEGVSSVVSHCVLAEMICLVYDGTLLLFVNLV